MSNLPENYRPDPRIFPGAGPPSRAQVFENFQLALEDTLLAAGAEKLAKLDIALKAYEATTRLSPYTEAKQLFLSLAGAIDEASAW